MKIDKHQTQLCTESAMIIVVTSNNWGDDKSAIVYGRLNNVIRNNEALI